MRSTITRYRASSPIFVPPSVTISAVIFFEAPSSFTLLMNAGGKLNSRPHIKPTIIGLLRLAFCAPSRVLNSVLRCYLSRAPHSFRLPRRLGAKARAEGGCFQFGSAPFSFPGAPLFPPSVAPLLREGRRKG